MATETPNIKLKIIEDSDLVAQDLINTNTEILETELTEIKNNLNSVAELEEAVDQAQEDISTLSGRITNNSQNISTLAGQLAAKEDKTNKGQPDGYASLDTDGRVPITQLPANVVIFVGGNIEIAYPWDGIIEKILVTYSKTKTSNFTFSVDKQTMADYTAKLANWQYVGGSQLILPAGEVYKEFDVSDTISAGDVLRVSLTGDDTGFTFRVMIKNN